MENFHEINYFFIQYSKIEEIFSLLELIEIRKKINKIKINLKEQKTDINKIVYNICEKMKELNILKDEIKKLKN